MAVPERDEHVEHDVPGEYVWVVEPPSHGVQALGQLVTRVHLAALAKVAQELFFHVDLDNMLALRLSQKIKARLTFIMAYENRPSRLDQSCKSTK